MDLRLTSVLQQYNVFNNPGSNVALDVAVPPPLLPLHARLALALARILPTSAVSVAPSIPFANAGMSPAFLTVFSPWPITSRS